MHSCLGKCYVYTHPGCTSYTSIYFYPFNGWGCDKCIPTHPIVGWRCDKGSHQVTLTSTPSIGWMECRMYIPILSECKDSIAFFCIPKLYIRFTQFILKPVSSILSYHFFLIKFFKKFVNSKIKIM